MSDHPYAAVVQRFLDGLGERRQRMREAIDTLSAGGDAEAAQVLRQEAHRIAGTAGSMGYPHLGAAALAVEDALDGDAPLPRVVALHGDLEAAAEGLALADSTLLAPRD